MKPQTMIPVLTALIGFSAAWVIKPAAPAAAPKAAADEVAARKSPRAAAGDDSRNVAATGKRPKEVNPKDFPIQEIIENGPRDRDEAKMLRLTEALGLTVEQQAAIMRLVEESHASASDKVPIIEDLTARGRTMEEALKKLLTQEQYAKFEELRERDRDNRLEVRAQRELLAVIEEVDLSPQQRQDALERLRQYAKTELQAIPNSASLLLEKSVLPTGKTELSLDGVLLSTKISEPAIYDNPQAAFERAAQAHQADFQGRLGVVEGVLTPAQLEQYFATLAEKKDTLKRLSESLPSAQAPGFPPPGP